MKKTASAVIITALLATSGTASAGEYKYELAATLDFSNADRAVIGRSGLDKFTDIEIFFYFNTPGTGGSATTTGYTPLEGKVSFDGNANTVTAYDQITIGDSANPANFGDGIFWHLDNATMASIGLPEIWALDVHMRFDPATFTNSDLPTNNSFMSSATTTHVEMLVRKNGPLSGVDWVRGPVTGANIDVNHSP